MPRERILTLNDLYVFCKENKLQTFNACDNGKPIICKFDTAAKFEDESDDKSGTPGLLYATIKVCHTLKNRNKSYIAEDDMVKAMPTLKDRPVLAFIHQLEDGTWDFFSHNMEIVKDENGTPHIEYQEKQIGNFTSEDPYLFYDEEEDKTFVVSRVAIPEDYSRATDIIQQHGGECKVSCEISINSMEYDADEDLLIIKDFYFRGVTLLGTDEDGTPIEEGMEGSKLITGDVAFNSASSGQIFEQKSTKKGGNDQVKLDELLAQYGKTVEDLDFDYKDLSDDELEAKFAESFAQDTDDSEPVTDGTEGASDTDNFEDNSDGDSESDTDDSNGDAGTFADDTEDGNGEGETEPEPETFEVNIGFELSHEDVRTQIYRVLCQIDRGNDWKTSLDIVAVFDNYFVYKDWNSASAEFYAQKYTKGETSITLEGEPYQVYAEFLTEEEKVNLDAMRASYDDLKQFKDDAEAKVIADQKNEILDSEAYGIISEEESFVELRDNAEQYSVDEIRNKADLLLAAYVKTHGSFSLSRENVENKKTFNISADSSTAKDNPYPGLFE